MTDAEKKIYNIMREVEELRQSSESLYTKESAMLSAYYEIWDIIKKLVEDKS